MSNEEHIQTIAGLYHELQEQIVVQQREIDTLKSMLDANTKEIIGLHNGLTQTTQQMLAVLELFNKMTDKILILDNRLSIKGL